jgi:hypothetical protein
MPKIYRKLTIRLLIFALAFVLTACTSEKVKTPANPPNEVIAIQALLQSLNEKKVEDAAAFFEEGATLMIENPCLEYFDEMEAFSYHRLAFGQLLTIQGKDAIKSHLQILVDADFYISESEFWYNGDTVLWHSHILLDHTSLKADFTATFDNRDGEIKELTITYTDLVNFNSQ